MKALALFLGLGVFSCTPTQLANAQKDFYAACQDWQGVKALAAPFAAVPAVAVTEGFVSDACDNQAFISAATSETVSWLQTSTTNLKAVVAEASK